MMKKIALILVAIIAGGLFSIVGTIIFGFNQILRENKLRVAISEIEQISQTFSLRESAFDHDSVLVVDTNHVPYLIKFISNGREQYLTDPWGMPYYLSNDVMSSSFVVSSSGKDRKQGTEHDIRVSEKWAKGSRFRGDWGQPGDWGHPLEADVIH
jgi:hypothetical protein